MNIVETIDNYINSELQLLANEAIDEMIEFEYDKFLEDKYLEMIETFTYDDSEWE